MKKFLILLPLTLFMLTACGGSDEIKTINTSTTIGQELVDLKAAKDQGIISEKEYNRAREDILDKYDN